MRVQEVPSNNQNLYWNVPVPPLAAAVKVTDVPGDCGLAGVAPRVTLVAAPVPVKRKVVVALASEAAREPALRTFTMIS